MAKKVYTYTSYNNRPYKLPSPEEMSDDLMAFTYNPKITPNDKGRLNMELYYNELIDVFWNLQYSNVKLYHEISATGKWHLHGFIKIHNKMKFTLFDLPLLMQDGVFEIDTIGDMEGWLVYIHKQKQLMDDILKEYKIPLEINSIDGTLKKKKIDPIYSMAKCKQIDPMENDDNEKQL